MRISIVGHSSSGKSTLARNISERLNIPHLHLDRFWFEAGGAKLKSNDVESIKKARTYIKEKVTDFLKREDSWVSDGWYSNTVQPMISEQANIILFLDIPLYRRLFNHLYRISKTDRHKELTKWEEFKFLYEIIRRTFLKDSKLRQFVYKHSDRVKTFRNYKEIEEYLNTL
ncbi:MAG: hypothetical protein WCS86_03190 [Candidatus Paceibacterota bacterium]